MTKTLDEFRATFATAQRETIDARAAELIAEEMTLRDLPGKETDAGPDGGDARHGAGECFTA